MDKPVSMSVKNFLIRRLAVEIMIPEKTIESVINHQFSGALDAMLHNNSVELSGFGKFIFNESKAKKHMMKWSSQEAMFSGMLENPELTEQARHKLENKLAAARDNIRVLKARTYEN